MKTYLIPVEIDSQQVEAIFERLQKAQSEIWACYRELQELGLVKIKSTTSGN